MAKQKTLAKKYLDELAAAVPWKPAPTQVKKLIKKARKDAPALRGKNPAEVLAGHLDTIIPGASGQDKQQLQEFRDALAGFDPNKLREILEWMDRCDGLYIGHYHQEEQSADEDNEDW